MSIEGVEQSLKDILKAKDDRVAFHEELLEKFNSPIISYKLNIPGSVKYNNLIKKIFDEGLFEIMKILDEHKIEIIYKKVIYKDSGPEAFISFKCSPFKVKDLCTKLEDKHILGRIFDIDILNDKGLQISRQDKNKKPRKCLLCDKSAFECGRSRDHDLKDLLIKIEHIATDYFLNK
ncbi:citrate lyase holo-[Clostridium sp. D2Q-14]|uniref:citrate lyase holo-[acyl-carrier protein] synthase n=1 Tax=Anaeromonas gelatinilytica TaxID=2683194 RepID=UPI00193C4B49|nr:citrate lyase holo-[acyl-carrier protein] synthase [Anaeromonas gelatinilytica]MBS4534735.1 citrate lyase holo-[acyl-carrier protein] synthase [Anaeromonas gelatinilytica]